MAGTGLCYCVIVCLVSCIRVGPLSIEAPLKKTDAEFARLHYFFDKTDSIRGFTAKGDDSHYVKTIQLLWQVGDISFSSSTARFFDYGTHYTNEFISYEALRYVKTEVLQPGFYQSAPTGGYRTPVFQNGGQPFTGVAKYIETLNDPDSVYIVVTDFYEQNRENPFFLFFRDAFSRGLSGALFSVDSVFNGEIHSFSYVNNNEKSIRVRDGISTFFICIIGDSSIVYEYCAALAKELSTRNISFNNSVFMVKAPQEVKKNHNEPLMAPNVRRFNKEENLLRNVNLRLQEITIINDDTSPYRTPESYQVLTKIGSRYSAGLSLENINKNSFSYSPEISLSYFNGKKSQKENADSSQSQFIGRANSRIINVKTVHIAENSAEYPVHFVVETDNRIMEKGWYKINCVIIPDAIRIPGWVSELNAASIAELEQSAMSGGSRVKTLELTNVYEKIAGAYNASARSIYSDTFYLLKR